MSRILFIDDNQEIREVCSTMLKLEFEHSIIETADSGNRAIDILLENLCFDIIISDYHMPNGMGHDVLSYLIRAGAKIPFVYFTSSVDKLDISSYDFSLGIIQKNDFDQLISLIKSSLKVTI